MGVWYIVASSALILICVAVVTLILLQQKRATGLSASVLGMGGQKTYWDKNKSRTLEGKIELLTKVGGALMVILSLAIPFIPR